MSRFGEFTKGIIKENPTFVLMLGLCPTLAVTTSVQNAMAMGLAVIGVLTCSNLIISLVRKLIPKEVRIPCFIVIIASFVTMTELLMKAYMPDDINRALGIFIPLIVVNCIILGRAEAFASKNGVIASALDGLGAGVGFTLAVSVVAAIRELLGKRLAVRPAHCRERHVGEDHDSGAGRVPGARVCCWAFRVAAHAQAGGGSITMAEIKTLLAIAISISLVNNMVLSKFLGLCPFIGVTKKTSSAVGMGIAVTFVMTMTSVVTWLLYTYVLQRFGLTDVLRTTTYILVIATLVQLVEMAMKKATPALYKALGIYLPLITTNCAVMGVALLNTTDARTPLTLLQATTQGFFAGVGFMIAMLLMSGIREQLEMADVPKPLQGVPIAFICTSFMSIAFMGFAGLVS